MAGTNYLDYQKVSLALRDTFSVISGKWKLIIVYLLLTDGPKRFRQLTRDIGISPRILSKELVELEMNKLITRKVLDTRPISVEYTATDYCKGLIHVIDTLTQWGTLHREVIAGKNISFHQDI